MTARRLVNGCKVLISAGVMLLGLNFPSSAQPMLDFGAISPTPGTISYAGGATPLVGTNIQIDNVGGINTPSNDGTNFDCFGCLLNFTTGNLTGSTAQSWDFGGGGSISLVGKVDANGDHLLNLGDIGFLGAVPLLSGSFASAQVSKQASSATFKIAGAAFSDVKDSDLIELFGLGALGSTGYSGGFNLSFSAAGSPPSAFTSSTVLSGDVVNAPPIPEPASVFLMGSALFGLGVIARRRRQA